MAEEEIDSHHPIVAPDGPPMSVPPNIQVLSAHPWRLTLRHSETTKDCDQRIIHAGCVDVKVHHG